MYDTALILAIVEQADRARSIPWGVEGRCSSSPGAAELLIMEGDLYMALQRCAGGAHGINSIDAMVFVL